MTIYKCDICKKQIKDNQEISIYERFHKSLLCLDCGKPIINFLKKKGLTKDKK